MIPYTDIRIGDNIAIKKTITSGDRTKEVTWNVPVIKEICISFINPQMYRRWLCKRVEVWLSSTTKDSEENGLIQGLNTIIQLDAIQSALGPDKLEPTDTVYLSFLQLMEFVELLGPSEEQGIEPYTHIDEESIDKNM